MTLTPETKALLPAGVLPTVAITKNLAAKFIERADALGYKGKKRDDAALDFFVGAGAVAAETGNAELAMHLTRVVVMIISVRGFFGVKELAAV